MKRLILILPLCSPCFGPAWFVTVAWGTARQLRSSDYSTVRRLDVLTDHASLEVVL
jgi:hypothetical protein